MERQDGPARLAARGRPASVPEPAEAPSGNAAPPVTQEALVERVAASGPRWLRPIAERVLGTPWFGDVLATATVALCVVLGTFGQRQRPDWPGHIDALNMAIAVGTCLPLLARRRFPLSVLVLTEAGQVLYLAADGPDGPILLPTLVALYTVAASERFRRSVWVASAAAVAHIVIRLAVSGTSFLSPDNYLGGIWMYLPVAIGGAVRAKRAYWAEVRARLARAEHEREEEARRRVTAERMRIARELHDVVAHSIAMINIQAGVAAHVIDGDVGQARQALVHIKEASRDALAELRTTLGVLRQDGESDHPTEPMPGPEALSSLVASYRTAGITTRLETRGVARPLPVPVGLAVYRIVQESLTNTVKHAGPGTVADVLVSFEAGVVAVEVTDDGMGGSAALTTGTGHGILGMRERAAAVGGTLSAGPASGGGFRVAALLPTDAGRA